MKIRKLRFKNLNSLAGEWSCDFTHPEYLHQGIFAITGPTGAGKSTILDAICLALYGQTPRLGVITKSKNEIMSRHHGECFAELEFSTNNGIYRCYWEQIKARKSATGNLQQVTRELADIKNQAILETHITAVNKKIVEITGMDFEHFTRAMLLAQGGFAKFLQATPDERSPILEQITGTQIYSEISMKVHERKTSEEKKLDLLNASLSGINPLTSEQKILLDTALTDAINEQIALKTTLIITEKKLTWQKELNTLETELKSLETKQAELTLAQNNFAPKIAKLARAKKADVINSDIYLTLGNLRKQINTISNSLDAKKDDLPNLQEECLQKQEYLAKKQQKLQTSILQQQTQLEMLAKQIEEAEHLINILNAKLILENKSLSLSKELAQLAANEPCPLCGSKEHPYKQNNPQAIKQAVTDTNEQQEQTIANLNKLRLQYKSILKSFTDKTLEQEEKILQRQLTIHEQNLSNMLSLITNLKEQLLPLRTEQAKNEAIFIRKLAEHGFNTEDEFKLTLLPREELSHLEKAAKELQNKQIELSSHKEKLTNKLILCKEKPLTTLSQGELTQAIKQLNDQTETINQTIGSIKTQLDTNQQALSKQVQILKQRDLQQEETVRWQQLHALIGSVDGKKFRNFAQGLTFELVVRNANAQLQKMSDRYLLIRDNNAPLELNVVDNYQGGEIRTTKNLSGGESFVVSLALSLGLSKLSSNKVQVDSLFLDEGFGTLDEDSLQTALEALTSLHQEGKLIGVISHVGALKEQISLQIQVEPLTGGISKISGLGCKKL